MSLVVGLGVDRPRGLCQPRGLARAGRRARRRSRQPRSRHAPARGREDVLPHAVPHRGGEMLWPHARLRRARNVELQQRVAEARRDSPESEAWLGLLEAALGESGDVATWDAAVPRPAADRPVKAPLLARTRIVLDGRAARSCVRRLLKRSGRMNPRTVAAVALLEAAERQRHLRCGRCGTEWAVPALRCVSCDETDHESLGYLTPEEGEQMRRVEVCGTCKGYLKAVTTVRPLAPWAILLDDLTTVHLDVAALERGYRRPDRPGYPIEARIAERPPMRGWWRLVEVGGGWWRSLRQDEA